jgi:hypothetical protein
MITASAPRGTMPPVAISVAVPSRTEMRRLRSGRQHLRVEAQQAWRLVRRAVHAGAIEAGDVHGCEHVARQHTASGTGQDHNLLAKGFEVEVRAEAPLGLVSRDDVEKLVLTRRPPEGLDRDLAVHDLITVSVCLEW